MNLPENVFLLTGPEALRFVTELGLLGDFPKYVGESSNCVELVLEPHFPSHWIVAVRERRNLDAASSAYTVFGFDKRYYTIGPVRIFIEGLHKSTTDGSGKPAINFPKPDRN